MKWLGHNYEWDEDKELLNIHKHKVSFEKVIPVFSDPHRVILVDKYESEDRWNIIGMANKLYFVVYTERDKDTIRIISARRATRKEVKIYGKNNKG